jgi:hypothetical protein
MQGVSTVPGVPATQIDTSLTESASEASAVSDVSAENTDNKVFTAEEPAIFRTFVTGRSMYGGGGITPDVMVAADTTGFSNYWAQIMQGGLLHEFAQNHLDTYRVKISADYSGVEDYIARFDASTLLPDLVQYAVSHGIAPDEKGLETSRRWLASQLKALIAQRLWDTTSYFRVFNSESDDVFERAVGIMARWRADDSTETPRNEAAKVAPVSDKLIERLAN